MRALKVDKLTFVHVLFEILAGHPVDIQQAVGPRLQDSEEVWARDVNLWSHLQRVGKTESLVMPTFCLYI